MPLLFTHVVTSDARAVDPEGQDYRSVAEACSYADKAAAAMICEQLRVGDGSVALELHIEDALGFRVATLGFVGTIARTVR